MFLALYTVSPEKCPNSSSLPILTCFIFPKLWNKVLLNLSDGHLSTFVWCFNDMKGSRSRYVLRRNVDVVPTQRASFAKFYQKCLLVECLATVSWLSQRPSLCHQIQILSPQDSNKRCIASQVIPCLWFLYVFKAWKVEKQDGQIC